MKALFLDCLTKSYGSRAVLKHASLTIASGQVIGLVGANGAGKTTMLRIAAGLIRQDSGWVRREGTGAIRYFGGELTLPGNVRASRWASLFGVESTERRLIGRLSRGTRQMLGLQAVLAHPSSDVVLLDEPWEGLDPGGSCWLTDRIMKWREAGSAVLVSSHRLHDLEDVCTHIVLLADGRCTRLLAGADGRPVNVAAALRGKMARA